MAEWLQSYSGVRARVGQGPGVAEEDKLFAFRHAYCYAISRLQAMPSPKARIVLAQDPRPTGEAFVAEQAAGVASAFRDLGVELELIHLGVVTTPVWQHSVRLFKAHGGVMVTASHNPLDNNGWKYATGVETFSVDPAPPGALLSPAEMGNLIAAANSFKPPRAYAAASPAADPAMREEAIAHYIKFVRSIYQAKIPGAKIVLDPNGGSGCDLASHLFEQLGVELVVVNGKMGHPAHPIDVETQLSNGSHVLDTLATRVRTEGALFGLAYDYDADRGNLAYVDTDGSIAIPSPQAAATINAAIALAAHRRSGSRKKAAVVASDGTSTRIKQLVEAFGARLCEVETGEINVVTAMRDLENEGFDAVVGVEGSNGGTVFAGSTCRDGSLAGAGALLAAADPDLRRVVADALGVRGEPAPGLAGFIAMLPHQCTLAARFQKQPTGWSRMVDGFERVLPSLFPSSLGADWKGYRVTYSYTRYAGPERPHAAFFGWKLLLARPDAEGFLWFRPSKTEAGVLRLIVDGPDEETARRLLAAGDQILAAAIGAG